AGLTRASMMSLVVGGLVKDRLYGEPSWIAGSSPAAMTKNGRSSSNPRNARMALALIAPPLLPQALAQRARNARRGGRCRHNLPLGRAAGNLQHQFCADRLGKLVAFLDRDDERAGATNHAILVIDVEVADIHRRGV